MFVYCIVGVLEHNISFISNTCSKNDITKKYYYNVVKCNCEKAFDKLVA